MIVVEARGVDFCTNDLTECVHLKRDVNADWATVKDAKVTGTLDLSEVSSLYLYYI